ncbi:P-loop containing nucleoside triphosphate hydrolase protein [Pholiota molesta]|nr:P-loop containing nucleoside triphosphate hydrolase protein [Pholiota molesta]
MLETPSVARVLHSESFRAQLSAVYIDEAHTVHESVSWRPGYSRLHLLRKLLGVDIPLVPLSATFPTLYRKSLEIHAGLKPEYRLINLGNFRPELSTIVAPMQHDANSFQDLTFVLPWNASEESIPQTIIYCDNLDMLTAMFWWFHTRLGSMRFPTSLVDILHSGLSQEHQKICTADFICGKTKILLGSDKIGAGMDFPSVQIVVQYRCQGLTLVKWEQRRGRGARRSGATAVGVILVEKSMSGDDGDLSTTSPHFEDPALLDLIHSASDCLEHIADHHLENPPRYDNSGALCVRCGTRCSNCNPALRIGRDLTWIMENFPTVDEDSSPTRPKTTRMQKDVIFESLAAWRLKTWKEEWMENWPCYGPDSLVSDSDLQEIAKRAHNISTLDTLLSFTHIPHEEELAMPLFNALQQILDSVYSPMAGTPTADSTRSSRKRKATSNLP